MTTDTRLTDSQIFQAYREAESTEDYARRIEAIVRKGIAVFMRTHRVVFHNIFPHHRIEKVEPDISMNILADAILRGDGESDDAVR